METTTDTTSLYRIPLTDIDGRPADLSPWKGKVLLIVNTASKCGYTPQYKGLQALHERLEGRGFSVLGFPSNDFGGQEPADEPEIKRFCALNFKVSFPMFSKVRTLGDEKHPLYAWLVSRSPAAREVEWNFEKFLVDRNGRLAGRFPSDVEPEAGALLDAIETLL